MSLPRATDVDGTWAFIAQGVDRIMVQDLENRGLTTEVYMNLYTAVHNYCVATHQGGTRSAALGSSGRGHHTKLLGGDLYARLSAYLQDHLKNMLEVAKTYSDTDLINYYNQCWARFTVGAKYLDHIFAYLNRHWVRHERDEGGRQRGVYEVYTVCLVLWRDHFFLGMKTKLIDAILQQIELSRDGHSIGVNPLKVAIKSLVTIGLDDQVVKRTSLLFYTMQFEDPFIKATQAYYTVESTKYLEQHGVVQYMRRVEQRLLEERQRVTMYLHDSTMSRLVSTCEDVLIKGNQAAMQNEFWNLLSGNREQECHILFRLLSRVPNSLKPVQSLFTEYVKQEGFAAVDSLVSETTGNLEPRAYVGALVKVHHQFVDLVNSAFEGSANMLSAFQEGFTNVINYNQVARPVNANGVHAKDSSTPEYLARFSDLLLKKSSKNADNLDVEKSLDDLVHILKYVDESDAFEKFYSRMLSRRLVHQASANYDFELSMISKLSDICGHDYSTKLHNMFRDMTISSELQQQFHRENPNLGPEFTPLVLGEGFWPLPHQAVNFKLPENLQPSFEKFQEFYDTKHSGRQLKWLWNFGKGELKINFAKSSKTGYILQVSMYQMVVLLAYNDTDELSTEQLMERTQMTQDLVANALVYIVKAGLLKQEPPDANLASLGTLYRLNTDFKSKKMRVNLNLPLKSDQKQELTEAHDQLIKERSMFLQSLIVRIMKARRELNHASLVQETMEQARRRFSPTVRDIKLAISALVDNEYLKREGYDSYTYLA